MYLLLGSILFGRHLYFSSATSSGFITTEITTTTTSICTPSVSTKIDTYVDPDWSALDVSMYNHPSTHIDIEDIFLRPDTVADDGLDDMDMNE